MIPPQNPYTLSVVKTFYWVKLIISDVFSQEELSPRGSSDPIEWVSVGPTPSVSQRYLYLTIEGLANSPIPQLYNALH